MDKQMKLQPRREGMEKAQIRINGAFLYYPIVITEYNPIPYDYYISPTEYLDYTEPHRRIVVDEGNRIRHFSHWCAEAEERWYQPMIYTIAD